MTSRRLQHHSAADRGDSSVCHASPCVDGGGDLGRDRL